MPATATARYAGLDLFRGLAVAGMIVVNTPGSWDHVWWPLDHAEWHGFTPTDLVFPAFLCAMGVALGLSFPRTIDRAFCAKVARRTLLLIIIGWAWQMLARPGIEQFRLFGVLPRLGLCYGAAALLAICTARRDDANRSHLRASALAIAIAILLAGYWAAMMLVPVPGQGAGDLSPKGNLAGWIDRALVGTHHMWRSGTDAAGNVVYDPEGLFSTLPALANTLFGMLAGLWWKRDPARAAQRLALGGIALALLGLALAPWFPLNKKLWTSSFALLTSGLSGIILAAAILAERFPALSRPLAPFALLGRNALLAYLVSLLIGLLGIRLGFQEPAYGALAGAIGEPYVASFLYALLVLAAVFALLVPLDRRGLYLRL